VDLTTFHNIKRLGKKLLEGDNPSELNWALVEEIIHLGRCEHALVFWSTSTHRELICQAHMNAQGKRGAVVGSTIALGVERESSRPSLNTWFRSGEVVNSIKLPRVIERMPLKTVLLSYGIEAKSSLLIPLNTLYDDYFGFVLALNATSSEAAAGFDIHSEELIALLASIAGATLLERTRSKRQESLFIELSTQPNTTELIETILDQAQMITKAEGGSLYLVKEPLNEPPSLEFAIVKNSKLGIRYGGTSGAPIPFEPIPMVAENGVPNTHNVVSCAANSKQIVIIDDAYDAEGFDFSGTKAFDETTGYRSKSFLTIPLKNHEDDIVAVLQLVNATDPHNGEVIAFKSQHIPLIKALATYAAIALNNRLLVRGLKEFLDAFIKTIAKAIDAKSPHTSGHCERVPLLMELIAKAACEDERIFSDFDLGTDEWYELMVSAWLHDCGKLATPDSVLEKSTKLHLLTDGIHSIEARMAAMAAQQQLDYLKQRFKNEINQNDKTQLESIINQAIEDIAFLKTANMGGESMDATSQDQVKALAAKLWQPLNEDQQPLLTPQEVDYLCIERGTLSQDERDIINNHIKVTIDMLEELPFPKKLRRVPEYAGGHHEKMDGTGFPRGLKRDQMSIPARMMAIADIFEALTAKDRPYKAPMKLSQALSIMKKMRDTNHIDTDIYDLFIRKKVWRAYAEQALLPEQLDVEEFTDYL
jgi:HD-GYP domain-containing protein (c-di-GMP phosphodiesterase class II)